MNVKRFLIAFVALYVFIFGYETLVHGYLLKSTYLETHSIWRSYAEMKNYVPFHIAMMWFLAFWITFIFTQLFKQGGAQNGLRFGLYFGVLSGTQAAGAYFYLPISLTLAGYWFVAYLIESLIGGYLIGFIYRK